MIQKEMFFCTTDGAPFKTVEEAQVHELAVFLKSQEIIVASDAADLAQKLLADKEHIVDLLTMKSSRSWPKARKVNGGSKKPRVPKPEPAAV